MDVPVQASDGCKSLSLQMTSSLTRKIKLDSESEVGESLSHAKKKKSRCAKECACACQSSHTQKYVVGEECSAGVVNGRLPS